VRLQLPNRISLPATLTFASTLFCVQLFEHTHVAFSLMFFSFVILSAIAFNTGGGFSRIGGAYVFWFSLLTMTFGITWKAVLGQAADSNTQVPLLGVTLYTCSMFMLLLVIVAVRKFDIRNYSVAHTLRAGHLNFTRVAIGCIMSALALQFFDAVLGAASGGLLSALNQLNILFPLSIIFATIGAIENSRGARSLDVVSGFAILFSFTVGALAFSKQGMLTPPVCWAVGAAYMRFRLRRANIIVLTVFAVFAATMVSPLSTLRDDVPLDATSLDRAAIFVNGIVHFDDLKRNMAEQAAIRADQGTGIPYFNTSQGGMIERFTMVPVDDLMFTFTAKGHYVGYMTVFRDFENWIPHFILPNKIGGYNGNYYAHEMGSFLAADDTTTGISFSPIAETYHVGGWTAIFLLLPAIWLLLFESMEFVTGDLHESPWGLFIIVVFAHSAPESLLSGLIYLIGYTNLALVAAMLFCVKVAPVMGSIFHRESRRFEAVRVSAAPRVL
jgi:hypothetical protein